MRREQRSILATSQKKEPEVIRKFAELIYLSGGTVCEGKTARQMVVNVSLTNPDYLSFTYDARFFGHLSSQVEDTFERMSQLGYVEEYYNTKEDHPVHNARKLSPSVWELVGRRLDDPSNPIKRDKLKELAAEVLSVTAVPIPISTAWGFYRAYIDKNRPDPGEKDVKKGSSSPIGLSTTISENSVHRLLEKFKEQDHDWLIQPFGFEKRMFGKYYITFAIKPDAIRKRYRYLMLREKFDKEELYGFLDPRTIAKAREYVKKMLDEFRDATTVEGAKSLLMNYAGEEFRDFEEDRKNKLTALLENYGDDIAEGYRLKVINKLDTIYEHLGTPDKEKNILFSYERIFDKLLGTLAKTSTEYSDEPKKRLGVEVTVVPKSLFVRSTAITSVKVYVPEEIKSKVAPNAAGGKWHFGLDLHLLHLPQVLERLYLLEKGRDDYVSTSLKIV